MDRVAKAERLVRDRLAVEETPAMWTALGDLTGELACYEKAWELSNHRYARAKRSLGRHSFRSKRYTDAVRHLSEALAIMPLVSEVWFIKGLAEMNLKDWEGALHSFTRCVQQNPDDATAWGNIGAVNVRVGDFARAFQAFKEGVKHKRDSAAMWENFLTVAVKLDKPQDAITAIHMLLDLRHNNKVEIDAHILNYLVDRAIEAAQEPESLYQQLPKQVAELLGRVTSVVTTDANIWEVYAKYNEARGKNDAAIDCRLKACRALMATSRWERDEEKVKQVVKSIERLVDGCTREDGAGNTNLHAIEMFLRSPVRLVGEAWEESDYSKHLLAIQQKLLDRVGK